MARATDEPDAMYGLVAESADVAADRTSVTLQAAPEAKFSDGTPVTADDVVFSFEHAEGQGPSALSHRAARRRQGRSARRRTVRYTFQGELVARPAAGRRRPAGAVEGLLSPRATSRRRRWSRRSAPAPTGSATSSRARSSPTSGATTIGRRTCPSTRGRYNFDEIRYEYYRDRTAALESFKAGTYDLREEFTSRDWATGYDIPAVKDGRMIMR